MKGSFGTINGNSEGNPEVSTTSNLIQRICIVCSHLRDHLYENFERVAPTKLIHPDFHLLMNEGDSYWHVNHDWCAAKPEHKIGFYFNDPTVLDGCPWVGKICINTNEAKPQYKYFCIVFGDPKRSKEQFGLVEMQSWAMQFDEPRLMNFNGVTLKILKEA